MFCPHPVGIFIHTQLSVPDKVKCIRSLSIQRGLEAGQALTLGLAHTIMSATQLLTTSDRAFYFVWNIDHSTYSLSLFFSV